METGDPRAAAQHCYPARNFCSNQKSWFQQLINKLLNPDLYLGVRCC